jgi:hypothetical protein
MGGGPDAGVTAAAIAGRLSKLEASVAASAVKQEQLDGLSRRMEGLQVCVCVCWAERQARSGNERMCPQSWP